MGSREALGVMVKLAGDAVLSLPDASGVTPLMYACAYGNEILTKYLLKKKVMMIIIILCSTSHYPNSAQANGSDRDIQGKTALHWAAECPQVTIMTAFFTGDLHIDICIITAFCLLCTSKLRKAGQRRQSATNLFQRKKLSCLEWGLNL